MKSIDPNIENQLIGLPHRDRARLALALIQSLDPCKDEDVTDLWLDEAERRVAAYDAGETKSRDAEASLADLQRQLK